MSNNTNEGLITPFEYQMQAANELAEYPGRMIADERGCGKTVTGVLLDQHTRERENGGGGATLIICPKNGLGVWSEHLPLSYAHTWSTLAEFGND